MFDKLDHLIVAVKDLKEAEKNYQKLFGTAPVWRGTHKELGTSNSLFNFQNIYFELLSPTSEGLGADLVNYYLDTSGEGLIGMVFATEDIANVQQSLRQKKFLIGDLSDGAFTLGFARFDSDVADAETDLEVGFSRRGGDGVDFSISAIATEDDTTFRARVFTPIGINLGYLTDGDVGILNIGYMWKW